MSKNGMYHAEPTAEDIAVAEALLPRIGKETINAVGRSARMEGNCLIADVWHEGRCYRAVSRQFGDSRYWEIIKEADFTEKLTPGTLVVCDYRMPTAWQPWLHEIHVGTVEEPGDNPAEWNGHNSERYYCQTCIYTRVRYAFGVQHESSPSLIPITPEQAALPHREKVALFLGPEALRTLDRASGRKEEPAEGEPGAPASAHCEVCHNEFFPSLGEGITPQEYDREDCLDSGIHHVAIEGTFCSEECLWTGAAYAVLSQQEKEEH